MEAQGPLRQDAAYASLQSTFNLKGKSIEISKLFADDPTRFDKFSITVDTAGGDGGPILVDFSKHRIDDEIFNQLIQLAESRNVVKAREAMFTGQKINFTENRAVLHIALRNRSNRPIVVDGEDVMPGVNGVLAHMKQFCDEVRRDFRRNFGLLFSRLLGSSSGHRC
jgi:glucose-6-phosphate isomerase